MPGDWQIVFTITKVLLYQGSFYYFWGKKNSLFAKEFVIYRFVILRLHCMMKKIQLVIEGRMIVV